MEPALIAILERSGLVVLNSYDCDHNLGLIKALMWSSLCSVVTVNNGLASLPQ
jgi:hypothetical protein